MNASPSAVGMLKLSVSPGHEPDYIHRAAAAIQPLAGVLRVRVDPSGRQLEIIYRDPTEGLLRAVHQALRLAGGEMVASKTF